ncbi:acyl carrier protein [Corallococcus praedator]|uniref:Acyl carrier protein n=1 Tax=Corallococcus praedator TaxID=2316724 RepID=A0ABX9QGF6_9BACT|nr:MULTISPECIES: acyl carrier protein [Corallococcus]RKH25963.1 acyl carrier protein [Corallococcus sp. CA031C]RKI03358.1 acyl carrier protein [Corallococcus praedator]
MPSLPSADALSSWLSSRIATYVQRRPEDIRADVPLADYGLDSVYALTLAGDLEDHLGLTLDPTLMWDHPTIAGLTQALLQVLTSAA